MTILLVLLLFAATVIFVPAYLIAYFFFTDRDHGAAWFWALLIVLGSGACLPFL